MKSLAMVLGLAAAAMVGCNASTSEEMISTDLTPALSCCGEGGECCKEGHVHAEAACCGTDGECCKEGATAACCGTDGECCKEGHAVTAEAACCGTDGECCKEGEAGHDHEAADHDHSDEA